MRGKITRVVADKGIGFISGEDGSDYAFQRSALQNEQFDALLEGVGVRFDAVQSPKGPQAKAVRVIKPGD